ncbi:type II toxin-antitoxin system RatA family toxin [Nocardia aurantia]|uniref:Coenzyme Q-binding protein COQ10 START domain-containing protein n=1 Tax=Nocardia aurantia TaxID=2585199 RepID=A0A7K0DKU8_9NOCA|nr:SRPBCC family protein [Nocardia aurantia]MQY26405.1 hypothetical protein [Nocardia aurantia]
MRNVVLTIESTACDAAEAYLRIGKFERYPELVDDVRSITVSSDDDHPGALRSDWEVHFRNGPLRWSEVDTFEPDMLRITFEQTHGDFEFFHGVWEVEPLGAGCRVRFEVTFDFGIPSLEGVLEPIATKVLKEGIAYALLQVLGDAAVVGDPAVSAALAAKLATTAA